MYLPHTIHKRVFRKPPVILEGHFVLRFAEVLEDMKEKGILFLMLLILVSSSPVNINKTIMHHSMDYVLSDIQMSVYRWVTPDVNLSYATTLASSIGIEVTPELVNGAYVASIDNRTVEIDTRDGGIRYADFSKLHNISLGVGNLDSASARTYAETYLIERGLLPEGYNYSGVSTSNASAYNLVTEEQLSKVLHYQINFETSIDGYPVKGPRAQVSVSVGAGGQILGFERYWRPVIQDSIAQVIEYESILTMNGISADEVVSHSLHYYAGPDSEYEELLTPTYEILVELGDGHGSVTPKVLHATEIAPIVSISSPEEDITINRGTSLTFDCNVTDGAAPFIYEWSSSIDGSLGSGKSFSFSNLSATEREGEYVPHIISVEVRDANGMISSDFITVNVVEPPPIDPLLLIIGVGIVCIIGVLFAMKRRRGTVVMLFLLFLLSAFMFIPVTSAGTGPPRERDALGITPIYYDDGIPEVGVEYIGSAHPKPLPRSRICVERFYDHMTSVGSYERAFKWGDFGAYEWDFKDEDLGGGDLRANGGVDRVDFVYYKDHGGPDGFSFVSEKHDTFLHYSEARWGDGDLEHIVLDACSVLRWENPDTGLNVWDRWGPALQGLHLMLGFATIAYDTYYRGEYFAEGLTRGWTVIMSWYWACYKTEKFRTLAAVLYATKSDDPWNPGLDDPINDHAHGFGYICTDPSPGETKWGVYLTNPC